MKSFFIFVLKQQYNFLVLVLNNTETKYKQLSSFFQDIPGKYNLEDKILRR